MRNTIDAQFKQAIGTKSSISGSSLAIEAYATDTDDDVKDLAHKFIKSHRGSGGGKVIVYGYSWGGDTATELAVDLKASGIGVDLLVTIDSALGPFNGPAVRDRTIPTNVKVNINHYTTTPNSGVLSRGLPNRAADTSKTRVKNVKHTGPTHGQMDEETSASAARIILDQLIGPRVCD